jgi:hypothetical protein
MLSNTIFVDQTYQDGIKEVYNPEIWFREEDEDRLKTIEQLKEKYL